MLAELSERDARGAIADIYAEDPPAVGRASSSRARAPMDHQEAHMLWSQRSDVRLIDAVIAASGPAAPPDGLSA